MIISEKCDCCLHEAICSFKDEYLKACNAIRESIYTKGNGYMKIQDSPVNVSIRCPHMMVRSPLRKECAENDRV